MSVLPPTHTHTHTHAHALVCVPVLSWFTSASACAVLLLLLKLMWDLLKIGWRRAAFVFVLLMVILWSATQMAGLPLWYSLLVAFLTPRCTR